MLSGIVGQISAPGAAALPLAGLAIAQNVPVLSTVNAHSPYTAPAFGMFGPPRLPIAWLAAYTWSVPLTATINVLPAFTAAVFVARPAELRHCVLQTSCTARSSSREVRLSGRCCRCRRNLYHMKYSPEAKQPLSRCLGSIV